MPLQVSALPATPRLAVLDSTLAAAVGCQPAPARHVHQGLTALQQVIHNLP